MDTIEKIPLGIEMFILIQKSQISQMVIPIGVSSLYLLGIFSYVYLYRDWELGYQSRNA